MADAMTSGDVQDEVDGRPIDAPALLVVEFGDTQPTAFYEIERVDYSGVPTPDGVLLIHAGREVPDPRV